MACATTEYCTEYVVCTSPGHQHAVALHDVRNRRAIPASCRSLFLRVRLRAAAGKENKDWNFQGQCKGRYCLRLFFFFFIGRNARKNFHAVSIYLCFTSSSCPLPSQHGHVSPPFLPYRLYSVALLAGETVMMN